MDSLADYTQWMGDFPISMTGFRDTDALILCALSYIDFGPLFSGGNRRYTLKDCREMIKNKKVKIRAYGGERGYIRLLTVAARSLRFGELYISDYTDISGDEPPLQFSAVCFRDDKDFSFLAFRGTDKSITGWKEDFMFSFTLTKAQELALSYAKERLGEGGEWYIGGQSKGGNLALYAAAMMDEEKKKLIKHIYDLDGPGFCPGVFDNGIIEKMDDKITVVVPKFCIVGRLFAPNITDTRIIKSSESGFSQHSIVSWGVDHGKLALQDSFEPVSIVLSEAVNEWISGLSPQDRAVLVEELFHVLTSTGASTFENIKGGFDSFEPLIKSLKETSKVTRHNLSTLPKYAIKLQLENLNKSILAKTERYSKEKKPKQGEGS